MSDVLVRFVFPPSFAFARAIIKNLCLPIRTNSIKNRVYRKSVIDVKTYTFFLFHNLSRFRPADAALASILFTVRFQVNYCIRFSI